MEPSNQTSQWACGATCCRSVWAEEVIKPHLCVIAASLFGTQRPQSLHLFYSLSLQPLKVGGMFCNPRLQRAARNSSWAESIRVPCPPLTGAYLSRTFTGGPCGFQGGPRVRGYPNSRWCCWPLWDCAVVGHQWHSKSLSLSFHLHLIYSFSVEENQHWLKMDLHQTLACSIFNVNKLFFPHQDS